MKGMILAGEKRLDYIDIIRGEGILSIIFVHTYLIKTFVYFTKYIYSFHIFLFFFISGYLFQRERVCADYGAYLKKLFCSLMIPYMLFSTINYVLLYREGIDFSRLGANLLYAGLNYGAIWFLPALFIAAVVGSFLSLYCKHDWLALVMTGFVTAAGLYISYSGADMRDLRLPQGLIGSSFWVFGYLFRKYEEYLLAVCNKGHCKNGTCGMAMIFLGAVTCFANEVVHFSRLEFGIIPLTWLSAGLTIVGIFMVLRDVRADRNPITQALTYFGKNSLAVLCTHSYLITTNAFFRYIPRCCSKFSRSTGCLTAQKA